MLVFLSFLESSLQRTGCRLLTHLVRACYQTTVPVDRSSWIAPKRALLLAKTTKYDFERSLERLTDDIQLRKALIRKGVNVDWLITRHHVHYRKLAEFKHILQAHDIDVHVVDRKGYTDEAIAFADIVFTAGGDGTFLLGASKIRSRNKLLIGLNTDPEFSVGYLCLPNWCTTNFTKVLTSILSGSFEFLWRQRIRTRIHHQMDQPLKSELLNKRKSSTIVDHSACNAPGDESTSATPFSSHVDLPCVALNEVFVGESLSARVSQYEISVDGSKLTRQKSSGVTLTTGTGSTSWYQQILSVNPQSVMRLMEMAQLIRSSEKSPTMKSLQSPHNDFTFQSQQVFTDFDDGFSIECAERVAKMYNATIHFDPSDTRMAFVVRDPLENAVFHVDRPQGYAQNVKIRSLMLDAHLVLDGGSMFPFPYGCVAEFTVEPEDALWCARLPLD